MFSFSTTSLDSILKPLNKLVKRLEKLVEAHLTEISHHHADIAELNHKIETKTVVISKAKKVRDNVNNLLA